LNKGFILDTDTVSFYLKNKESVVEQFKKGEEVSVNVWCPKKLLVSGYIPTWFWSQ
jgi:hypothetical protein